MAKFLSLVVYVSVVKDKLLAKIFNRNIKEKTKIFCRIGKICQENHCT